MLWERGCHPCFDFAALHPEVIWPQRRCELSSSRTRLSALPPPGAALPSAGGCCVGSRWVLSAPGEERKVVQASSAPLSVGSRSISAGRFGVRCPVVKSGEKAKSWVCVQGEVFLAKPSQLGGICLPAAPGLQSSVWFYSWRDWAALSLTEMERKVRSWEIPLQRPPALPSCTSLLRSLSCTRVFPLPLSIMNGFQSMLLNCSTFSMC